MTSPAPAPSRLGTPPDPRATAVPGEAPDVATADPGAGSADDVLAEVAGIVDDVAEREFEPAELASMDALDTSRRLLLVHAHPDDETIGNGATMAAYASAGVTVTLVTCTRGERGEVVEPSLAHLAGDGPALGAHRVMELATAMEALGVTDHRFLDDAPLVGEDAATTAAVHYEDSGMVWGPGGRTAVADPATGPRAFARSDAGEAAARLAGVLREVRPQVLITYDATGGYGHPDHVRAREVAIAAVALAASPADGSETGVSAGQPDAAVLGSEPWQVAKVYESVVPLSQMPPEMLAALGDGAGDSGGQGAAGGELPGMVVSDEEVTAVIAAPEQLPAKVAALRAHASQLSVRTGEAGPQLTVAHDVWIGVHTTEAYRLWSGSVAPASPGAGGVETDLFAGLVR